MRVRVSPSVSITRRFGPGIARRTALLICVLACCRCALAGARETTVPAQARRAVVSRDWSHLLELLPAGHSLDLPVELRLLRGHACLATNRNNESLCLFLSAAEVPDEPGILSDLADARFALVMNGNGGRLDPQAFRKFVTALWAVYYSSEDPGVSIDPIAPGVDRHLVRYIGRVANTDLGRVMREADYLMKKWSVGAEWPRIPGFKSPDDISGTRGYAYLGASRFWFIPDRMRFKGAEDLVLFDEGGMRLQTEYLFRGAGLQADPANEEFARFFTEHYEQIARTYPVYEDLLECAKLVSLAKYLKNSGVPLLWFLMAHKDLVLTEDSPGTVDAISRDSDHFRGLVITGGVDLRTEGQYLYDAGAAEAITRAVASRPAGSGYAKAGDPSRSEVRCLPARLSFTLGNKSCCIFPQHSLISGVDRRGTRYQTDLALNSAGCQLTEESWGRLCSSIRRDRFVHHCRRLAENLDPSTRQADDLSLQEQAWQHAEQEADLTAARLRRWMHRELNTTDELVAALAEVVGEENAQDVASLVIEHARYEASLELVRYYDPARDAGNEFGRGWHLLVPYRIERCGHETRKLGDLVIPHRMAVESLLTGERQVVTVSEDTEGAVRYTPQQGSGSDLVALFLMTDGSYRLTDKLANEFRFSADGRLTDMVLSENHRIHIGYERVPATLPGEPRYRLHADGQPRIQFLNVRIPQTMLVEDLANGTRERFTFSRETRIAGYVPVEGRESHFSFLTLMSDGSFRLVDNTDNEIAFAPDGRCLGAHAGDRWIPGHISAGPYRIDFVSRADAAGRSVVESARLSREGSGRVLRAISYDYDDEGRLRSAAHASNPHWDDGTAARSCP